MASTASASERTRRPVVCFFTPKLVSYRTTFFTKLAADDSYDWCVLHGAAYAEDGRPEYTGEVGFRTAVFHQRQWSIGPFSLMAFPGLASAVWREAPAVLVVPTMVGVVTCWRLLVGARLRGCRTLTWSCGWERSRGPWARFVKRLCLRLFLRLGHRHLAYSSKARDYLLTLGVPSTHVAVCYNGIETDPLQAREAEIREHAATLRTAGDGLRVLYVGALLPEKRVDLLLRACALLRKQADRRKFVLWIVGDGPARAALEKQAAALALDNVRFWGRIMEGVDPLFAAADVFVLPGIGGLGLNQALFWEVPCIVSEADGTEDDLVFDGRTGRRFRPGDAGSLAESIAVLLSLPASARRAMGQAGRQLVLERSNVSVMAATFHQTIHDLLDAGEASLHDG